MSESVPDLDLRDLFENAPCGYVTLDDQAQIMHANATLLEWIDCEADEVVGRRVHELLGMGGKIAYETHIAPLLRMQGFVHEIALDLKTQDGSLVPVIANASERRSPEGSLLLTRLTIFKSVDRRRYERDLLIARRKAEEEAKRREDEAVLREQFVAVLGHDLRNPLAAVQVGSKMLESNHDDRERTALIIAEIGAATSRALDLVKDVMDFARGRLGSSFPVELERSSTLQEAIEHVVSEVQIAHPEREISYDISVTKPVDCDEARICQLFANLVSNALQHGDTETPVEVRAWIESDRFHAEVANAGAPIPREILKNLFQPFHRGKSSRNRDGLGLGLYIVNQIAEAHGGEMSVLPKDGKNVFRFEMPTRQKSIDDSDPG
ncbi:PAS domain-containing sensor histidine kinase [Erythrobacter alti]|uniref:PAS domain-containing sensor histidine kinase n=1 Tax=Erythrobacter alti TaxID=1896145 RepID=UPI0030F3ABD6